MQVGREGMPVLRGRRGLGAAWGCLVGGDCATPTLRKCAYEWGTPALKFGERMSQKRDMVHPMFEVWRTRIYCCEVRVAMLLKVV